MGSVFRRASDGYWVAQVTRKHRTDRRRFRSRYAHSEEDAWEKPEDLLQEGGWID